VFLELWKRQRAQVVTNWKLYGWDEDEVRMPSFLLSTFLFRAGYSWAYRNDLAEGPLCGCGHLIGALKQGAKSISGAFAPEETEPSRDLSTS